MAITKGQHVVTLTISANATVSSEHRPERGYFPIALAFPSGTTAADFTIEYDVSDTAPSADWRTVQWQDVDYAVSGAAGKIAILDQAAMQALIMGYPIRVKSSTAQTNAVSIGLWLTATTA